MGSLGAGLLLASMVAGKCVYFVDGGQRALVFDRFKGIHDKIFGEGMHFVIPIL